MLQDGRDGSRSAAAQEQSGPTEAGESDARHQLRGKRCQPQSFGSACSVFLLSRPWAAIASYYSECLRKLFQKNMQKFRTQVSHFEHENNILLAENRRLEQQVISRCSSSHVSHAFAESLIGTRPRHHHVIMACSGLFQCMNCQECNKDLSYRVTKNDQSEQSDKVRLHFSIFTACSSHVLLNNSHNATVVCRSRSAPN